MRGAGAAQRREREPSPPPDAAAVVAKLERVSTETAAVLAQVRRRDGEIAAAAAKIASMPAECPSAERLALAADKLGTRLSMVTVELISAAAHLAELREEGEKLAALIPSRATAYAAGREEGLREAADLAAASRPLKARHAARSRPFRVVGGIAAGSAVAASVVAGGAVVATRDSAQVRVWAVSRPVVRLHAGRPDTAVLAPQPRPSFASPRPSVAAASARPAPKVAPPSPSPSWVPPVPVPVLPAVPSLPPPALAVQPGLDLGALFRGPLAVTAGPDAVTWTVTSTDGITVSQDGHPVTGGTLTAGQELDLSVFAPAGHGVIHFWVGTGVFTVLVSQDAGAPVLALP